MNRAELEHVIRAASGVVGDPDIIVIGSQAILAEFPNAPAELLQSMEADVYPRAKPELSIQIDGAIGERSMFHETFGYYAHAVDENTATLPSGWRERLVPIKNQNTGDATGWCLEAHDLAVSKVVAGREKDVDFVRILLREKMISRLTLGERLAALTLAADHLKAVHQRLLRI
jgi:hypothetical protein